MPHTFETVSVQIQSFGTILSTRFAHRAKAVDDDERREIISHVVDVVKRELTASLGTANSEPIGREDDIRIIVKVEYR